jgi:hypothetical protein
MKISLLVFLVISSALTLAASDATGSNPAPQRLEGAASTVPTGKRRVQHRAAKANQVPKPPHVANTNRLKRPANGQARSTTSTARLQPRSRLSQSVVVEKRGSIQNKSVTSVSAVQRQSMFPSSSPSLGNQRHRGANPAVIGGLGTSKASETGAINGSHISRKP